jgi:transcriptional regulator with XRE-family HTH domain
MKTKEMILPPRSMPPSPPVRRSDARELKGWTQEEVARQSGNNAKNITMLENDRIDIGKRRAEQLAKAFKVHPAIIMFPEYEGELNQQAA